MAGQQGGAGQTLRGPLARLDREREALAKTWLVRLIERSSLDEISAMPTDRLAAELPQMVSDLLMASAGTGPATLTDEARSRAVRIAGLRGDPAPAALMRDIAVGQTVILDALVEQADDLGGRRFAEIAAALGEASGVIGAAAVEEMTEERVRELQTLASSDPLTGLANVRRLREQIRHALGLHKRYGHVFALLVLDVDGLKRINEAGGRSAGDRTLVGVAETIEREVRDVDTAARIGDDEFCVLTPDQDAEAARPLAARLLDAVSRNAEAEVSCTIGVVSCPGHGETVDELLDAADAEMFRAKADGGPVALDGPGGNGVATVHGDSAARGDADRDA